MIGQRWTAHTRADGSVIEFRYDRAGRKIATVDPLGRASELERDEAGQIIAQTAPDGSRWARSDYNRQRRHSAIGMISPEAFEA